MIVKPSSWAATDSPLTNRTTVAPDACPSRIVTAGPPVLLTMTSLPEKSIVAYVPGLTRIVSPGDAALIAAWIVEY